MINRAPKGHLVINITSFDLNTGKGPKVTSFTISSEWYLWLKNYGLFWLYVRIFKLRSLRHHIETMSILTSDGYEYVYPFTIKRDRMA